MTDPIRLLHFADIHIGMENYGHVDSSTGINTRVIDFLRRVVPVHGSPARPAHTPHPHHEGPPGDLNDVP